MARRFSLDTRNVCDMLKKIDCVMIYVEDVESAADYYESVFGMRKVWRDETSCGLAFPETDAEIVLHNMPDLPSKAEVHYLVDDVPSVVKALEQKGCQVIEPPFDIAIGKCAVIKDPFGTVLSILDMSTGPRT